MTRSTRHFSSQITAFKGHINVRNVSKEILMAIFQILFADQFWSSMGRDGGSGSPSVTN